MTNHPEALVRYCKKYNIPIEIYSDFKAYCLWIMPDIDGRPWQSFHHYIMERTDFYIKRGWGELIVEMPQRHGKTQIMGKLLSSYFLGLFPDKAVLYCTNTSARAKEFTKEDLYELLFSEKYKRAFPRVRLKYDLDNEKNTQETKEKRKAATLLEDRFDILYRKGQYNARGVDQAINGIRAHLMICDDPYANYADAQSDIIREKTTKWYDADATGRTEAKTIIINISTRYHDEDIIGHVRYIAEEVKQNDPSFELPEVITFKAEAEIDNEFAYDERKKGEYLIPEFKNKYLKIKHGDPITWACVYQQTPINTLGLLLKLENLKEYLYNIKHDNIFISIDTNMKATAVDGDKAGITIWQYTHPNKYLVDFVYEQYNFVELVNCITTLIHSYPNYSAILIEGRASGDALADILRTKFPRIMVVEPTKSKVERFQSCLPEFHAGNVWLPPMHIHKNIWEYKKQLLNFTGEKKNKDDLVDSTSMFLNYIRENIIMHLGSTSLITYKNNVAPHMQNLIGKPSSYRNYRYGKII